MSQIEACRQNEILCELPDNHRVALMGDHEPDIGDGQLSAYHLVDGRLVKASKVWLA